MSWEKSIVTAAILAYGVACAGDAEQDLAHGVTNAGDAEQGKAIASIKAIGGKVERVPMGFMVSLSNTKVTDAGLVHLAGIKGLRTLGLINTRVTDAGIKRIARSLPNLNALHSAAH